MLDDSTARLSKAELQDRIQRELWGQSPRDFAGSITGTFFAIVAARYAPHKHRFTPLLVLGTLGSLYDWFEGQRRAAPFKRALDQLE